MSATRLLPGWIRLVRASALVGAFHIPVSTDAQQVSYTGSVRSATGDYVFAARTGVTSIASGVGMDAGRFHVSLSLPLLIQNRPWVTASGAGPLPTGGPQHATVAALTSSADWRRHRPPIALSSADKVSTIGIGDPLGIVEVDLVDGSTSRSSVRAAAAIKPPIADADAGFGTGAWDAAGGIEVSQALGVATLFLEGAYWLLGDMPRLDLRNVLAYGASVGAPLGRGPFAGVVCVSGTTPSISGVRGPLQVGASVSRRWLTGRVVSAAVSLGLTNTAPDFGATILWRIPLVGAPRVIVSDFASHSRAIRR